jgi:hypothetical protein
VAVLDHALGQQQVAGLEHLELRQHVDVADRDGHLLEIAGRVDEDVLPHVHAAHVEAADFRLELDDVLHALGRRLHGGAGLGLERIVCPGSKTRARAGGEVDQDVAAAAPDPLDHLAVVGRVHARPRGLGIAHVDVHDRRAGLGGIERGLRDLCRGHRHRGIAARRVRRPGHRA